LNRGVNCDEQTIYPDAAVKILTFQPTFGETIFNMIAGPYWWYGYPFDIISAIPLIIPRIIYGNDFSSHFALNILLLRQFVSVLPMLIALIILVYLVTEFKSPLPSAGLFIFFLSLPGVVLNNIRFWHPDGIIVLLTALTIFYLKRDDLQFGKHFYYAAVCCSLSASIKIWGVFFFVAVGGYIVAGIIRKKVSGKKGLLAGLYFILVMVLVFVMFNPNWLAPWLARNNIESILDQQNKIFFGFEGKNEPEVYKTGLANWLTFSSLYFMKPAVFFICLAAVLFGSILGSRVYLNRLILGWCLPGLIFLIYFSALKSPQYMLPILPFLYIPLALLPKIGKVEQNQSQFQFFQKKPLQIILLIIPIVVMGYQFVNNALFLTTHVI